jgi:hypothetical protein
MINSLCTVHIVKIVILCIVFIDMDACIDSMVIVMLRLRRCRHLPTADIVLWWEECRGLVELCSGPAQGTCCTGTFFEPWSRLLLLLLLPPQEPCAIYSV